MDKYLVCILLFIVQSFSVNGQMLVSHTGEVIISSSSQHGTGGANGIWYIYHVVDSTVDNNPEKCKCCGATNADKNPWYNINLGEEYTIQRIRVIGRPDTDQTLYTMKIQLGTTESDGTELDGVDTTNKGLRELNYTLTSPTLARFITLTLRDITQYFVICELYVYADCIAGQYGSACNETCGNCINNAVCDKSDGNCPRGCSAGYKGTTCKEVCMFGKYGLNCANTCGRCDNNATCNNADGECTSCVTGYIDPMCKECMDGRYGSDCNEDCGKCINNDACDKSSGSCSGGCSAGYKGDICQEVCDDNYYGPECVNPCGKCKNNEICDGVTGACSECLTGYESPLCQDCSDRFYGSTCEECGHCINTDVCEQSNGNCHNGCSAGYKGTTCKEVCSSRTYGVNCESTCGNCKNNAACNTVDGGCTSCVTGYLLPMCNDCIAGQYGSACNETCGNCINNAVCDKSDGNCPRGCSAGYKGTTCKEVCMFGKYGLNCANTCGRCDNNATCNNADGECTSCVTGYIDPMCKECMDGRYGSDCNEDCGKCINNDACDKSSGSCSGGCSAGYKGDICQEVCDDNYYGPECVNPCGKCKNNEICDGVTGACSECLTGYESPLCQDCSDRFYGSTCEECGHCINTDVCEQSNGNCHNGCSAGYKGTTCKEVCSSRTYGVNCESTCGNCKNNAACNTVDGGCTSCVTGYLLPMCNDCIAGQYGSACNETCGNCINNAVCDKSDGNCPRGCSAGYKGTTCKEVCMFGKYGLNCANTCGRCDNNATCNNADGECTSCVTGYIDPMCKECMDGRYGSDCNEDCGKCINNDACDKSSGSCSGGCSAGYKGDICQEVCSWGKYGLDCAQTCGNCKHNDTCNNVNGSCTGCVTTGYLSPMCKDCIDERYGATCNEDCGQCFNSGVCNKSNGICQNGCSAGYKGITCKEKCEHGSFGLGCAAKCGNCSNNETCNTIDGSCASCAAGYKGNACLVGCESGKFGENCVDTCGHCHNETTCKPDSGECEQCKQGYHLPDCIQAVIAPPPESPSNVPVGPIAGAIAGVIVVAIVVAIVVFLRKRRSKETGSASSNQSFQGIRDKDVTENPPLHIEPKASVQVKKGKKVSTMKKQAQVSVKHQPSVPSVPNEPETETENVYYAFLSKKSDLKICQLWDYIKFKKAEDCVMFYQEYSRLADKLKHPYDVAMKPKNRGKNRYKGLYAYDHSRVPLVVEDDKEVEYINASFIDGYEKPHKFIASQGPIVSMRDDFWRMVWQQKSKNIVMLTNLIENGADKCILYWPPVDVKTVTYGKITITLKSENSTNDYVIRQMEISKKGEDSTLPVTQFHYRAWPDKSYPDSTWSLIKFWLNVEEDTSKVTDNGPIVVHCSAGIGRTGTYIALDNAYYQAKKEGTVRILDVVQSLREQRVKMVQTKDQYVYLHEAVADALLFGTHFVWSTQFEDAYEYLSQKESGSYITRLQSQFNIIVESIADKRSVYRTVEDDDNEYSNIFIQKKPEHLTIDEYRPKSKSLVYVQEVGALILQSHEEKDAFIICKSPTESRMTEFWSLVKEQNVKTIVSLADVSMTSNKRLSSLGLENKAVQEKFGLSLAEERKTSIFTERKINLNDSTDDITISQFEFNKWESGDNIPKDPSSMAHFVEAVLDRQRRLNETEPVLIYCNNGTRRCGVMCALLSEVYRMNRDGGHINIIETVKMMKERNDDIIANIDQYVFIHDVIRSRVQDNTYQNQ